MSGGAVGGGPVLGIGVDSVDIGEMSEEAFSRPDWASVLAGKFAAKEAVFKALAWRTAEGFDLRAVETLEDENGRPRVTTSPGCALAPVLAEAGVRELLVSITNERGVATAFALAQ